jgi:CheY-like chemotaxis protein
MRKPRVLVSDNDPIALADQKEFLEDQGFSVLAAKDRSMAEQILEQGIVDVAVLDARLEDDNDEKDISGLELATTVAPQTPKVIYSRLRDPVAVRHQLYPDAPEITLPIDFVCKKDGLNTMRAKVEEALALSGADDTLASGRAYRYTPSNSPIRQRSRMAIILLLLALGTGIVAMVNIDPRWLIATVILVILAVLFVGIALD